MKRPFPEAVTFIVLFVLNTSAAFAYNLGNEIWQMLPIRIGAAFINGMGVTLLTTICLHYIHKYLRVNLTFPVLLLAWIVFVTESFLLLNFYTLITPSCFLVLFETNSQEASEFMSSYFDISTLLLLTLLLLVSFSAVHFRHRIRQIRFPAWSHNKKILLPFCIITLFCYAGLTFYITRIRHMTSYQALTGIERTYHSLKNTVKDRREYQRYMKLAKHTPPVLTENQSTVPYIIIILGESLSKWHMSAYNYPLNTTPGLSRLIRERKAYRYDSVTAAKTITAEAIRRIMTFYDDEADKPWYQYHTLPEIMAAAGYQTYWLSNQDSFNTGDDNSTASIVSTCSTVAFTHYRHASEERYGYFDGDLLPLLDKQLQSSFAKAFFCLHLMGSHRRYTNRFPADFSKFGISDIRKDVSKEKKRTIAEYDNSVLYNDYVVNRIIERFENKDALVFYFPDHGEEVYDTRNMSGHSIYNPSAPMYEIPFIIWTSPLFKESHPGLNKKIQNSIRKKFNTSDLIHTIMDITDIESPDYHEEKSLFR